MNAWLSAGFLAVVVERLIEWFINPVFKKYSIDSFYLLYIGLVLGGLVAWFTGLNLFSDLIETELLGRLLTCAAVGGGSNLIHDLAAKKPSTEVYFDSGNPATEVYIDSGNPVTEVHIDSDGLE